MTEIVKSNLPKGSYLRDSKEPVFGLAKTESPEGRWSGPGRTRDANAGNSVEDPGVVVSFIVPPSDRRALARLGGPPALSEILAETIERDGLPAVLARLVGGAR